VTSTTPTSATNLTVSLRRTATILMTISAGLDGFAEEFANGDHFTNVALQLETISQLLAVAIHRLSARDHQEER
jgi:hypothetical protein